MITSHEFVSQALAKGYGFYSGVPCSFLKPLINHVLSRGDLKYVAAASEGEAVGIASGAYLAGRKSVVMCQNSGLGNAVNPLTSLNHPFGIPLLLIVTLRGEPGLNDEPQHELMGRITQGLLDTMGIPWQYFPSQADRVAPVLEQADEYMQASGLPYALIMKKGSVSPEELSALPEQGQVHQGRTWRGGQGSGGLQRHRAIEVVRSELGPGVALVATTGKIGRELFSIEDSANQLYVVGSMGCALGMALGVTQIEGRRKVAVLDGDGAALMKMGTLATVGHYQPQGLLHVILDNEAYDSTGGQHSVSGTVDFCGVAASCGYRACFFASNADDLSEACQLANREKGPCLIHVKVEPGSRSGLGRPTLTPRQVKRRFMSFLESNV
jgi:phosphonopyruvate decarboxylase